MSWMFYGCDSFNNPLNWDTSSVTSMTNMFRSAYALNSDLVFETGNVISMAGMFDYASTFNSPSIMFWDVGQVKSMERMFYGYSYGTDYDIFNVDISAWNVESVTNFDYMLYVYQYSSYYSYDSAPTTFNQVLCWDLDFSKNITLDSMFYNNNLSLINPDAAKCACAENEYYNGAACTACEANTISSGKTESCILCTDSLCQGPSPSPTESAKPSVTLAPSVTFKPSALPMPMPTMSPTKNQTTMPSVTPAPTITYMPSTHPSPIPSVTPAPTITSKPSADPSPVPTMDPTMLQMTTISSKYISTPAVKTEILHAEEIMLNGVELSASNRRLTTGSEVFHDRLEDLQRKVEMVMANLNALQTKNDEQRAIIDAQQAIFDDQQAINDAHQAAINELRTSR